MSTSIKRPLNPPLGDFRTNQGLKSPPAGRRNGVPVGVNLGGEMRLVQLPQVIMKKRKHPLA